MRIHPSPRTLSAFVDADAGDPRRARVARHLEGCAACRAAVARLRALSLAAEEMAAPPPPDDALSRILARRAAGDRVILPVEAAPAASTWRIPRALVAACVAAVLLGGALLLPRPELQAAASELRFGPEHPEPGATVRVEYRPGTQFPTERTLVLRARLRTPRNQVYEYIPARTVAVLERDGDVYRGSFPLPDSVVYGAFAVEDSAASRLDDNGSRLWELLVHDAAGRPLYVSLKQKESEMHGRNWQVAYDAARLSAQLYPDTVNVWNQLRFFESQVLGEAGADSLRQSHLVRLHAFERRLEHGRPGADELGAMMWYAKGLRDSVAYTRWRTRMLRDAPDHPLSVQERVVDWVYEIPAPLMLQRSDSLWNAIGARHDWQVLAGLDAAHAVADPDAVRRWTDRYLVFRPREWSGVAWRMAQVPALRQEAMQRLRAEIARLETTEERELERTGPEQRQQNRERQARVLARLGRLLLEDGHTRAGLDTLQLATAVGWDPELFHVIGRARLAAGDSAGGMQLLARVAVDPGTARGRADSVSSTVTQSSFAARWEGWMDEARAEMRRRVLARAVSRPLPASAVVERPDGEQAPLSRLTGSGPAVVVFWSRYCGPALEALPEIVAMRARLAREGVEMLLVVDERRSEGFSRFLAEKGITFPVYYDTRRQAAVGLSNWGTPKYHVVDTDGRIRFDDVTLESLPRLTAVLRMEAE